MLLSSADHDTTLWTQPGSSLPAMETARKSEIPISFKISFNSSQLPDNLEISTDLLKGTLKEGTAYTVVTVAIVKWKVRFSTSIIILCNISPEVILLVVHQNFHVVEVWAYYAIPCENGICCIELPLCSRACDELFIVC